MNKKEQHFVDTVWEYYKQSGRHTLPWRITKDPYKILVSEVMLQQTQVDRVIPKYKAFLKKFPTVKKLALASLGDVLVLWQGLGYNRRAKMLWLCAQKIVQEHKGVFPVSQKELIELPGIGPYTSSAVVAFAFNEPVTLIETNVRSVFLHHFFNDMTEISDAELLPLIEKTKSQESSREWYYALMDYGSYIKKEFGNPNTKSAHHTIQSTFKGSDRQIRGALIRTLTSGSYSRNELLQKLLPFEDIRVDAQLLNLTDEGLILYQNKRYRLP